MQKREISVQQTRNPTGKRILTMVSGEEGLITADNRTDEHIRMVSRQGEGLNLESYGRFLNYSTQLLLRLNLREGCSLGSAQKELAKGLPKIEKYSECGDSGLQEGSKCPENLLAADRSAWGRKVVCVGGVGEVRRVHRFPKAGEQALGTW